MAFLTFLISGILLVASPDWLTNFAQAKTEAQASHKQILVNFSGSDWCGPCIKMKREVFDSETFTAYAGSNLVLVNIDFPRLKRNQLPKEQVQLNETLAEEFNKEGIFPLTLLLDENGKVLKTWRGNPGLDAADFVAQIQRSDK